MFSGSYLNQHQSFIGRLNCVCGRQAEENHMCVCVCVYSMCKSQHAMDSAEGFAQALLCDRVHKNVHTCIDLHTHNLFCT